MKAYIYIAPILLLFNTSSFGNDLLKADGITINSMVMYQEAGDGCGCYYYHNEIDKTNFMLFWPINNNGTGKATIKVNNKLEYLDYINEKISKPENTQSFTFKNKQFKLVGNVTEYNICGPREKYCEVRGKKGILKLSTSKKSITAKIKGTCGC